MARDAPEISVVFPVYNERDNLAPLLEQLTAALRPLGRPFELVAVDDGSRDGSDRALRALRDVHAELKVISFRRNFGQSAALDAGFRAVAGKVVVTLDSDLQNDPADIPGMIAVLEKGEFDLVSGWRRVRKDGLVFRRVPSLIANWIIRRVTRTRIHDMGCTLKVYRRAITDELRLYGELHRFIVVLAEGVGARVTEVETRHRPRIAGVSKYGLSRTLKVVLDLTTIWFMRGFKTKPIYLFGTVGAALMGLGALSAAVVLWQKFALSVWVHRNPLLIVAVMFTVVGVQFLALGLLAEIMIRMHFETHAKPSYSVAERLGFEPEEAAEIDNVRRIRSAAS